MGILIARIVMGLILLGGVALVVALYYLAGRLPRHSVTPSSSAVASAGTVVIGAVGIDGGGGAC